MFYYLVSDSPSIAIWAMMVACVLPFLFMYIAKAFGGFKGEDNAMPRTFLATLTGLPARANAVQQNSFETLPMFLASVIVAMLFFVPQVVVNTFACFYVLLRVLYGVVYLLNWAWVRSVVWALSFMCIMILFYFTARFAV